MKNFLTIICLIAFSIDMADAQTSIILNDKVTFESSSDLNFLLDAHYDKNKHCDLMQGYRIQIMNSSNREDVYKKKAEVYSRYSKFKGYIVYDQPYYKLRIGDFETKLEARKFLNEIIQSFSTAFIVRDEIKIN
ncbi:MAG: SPOR domain-containing protein [Chitinophagales bacterium]|nr:SPOR domain-containing protein [Chitinophagales bacterium]